MRGLRALRAVEEPRFQERLRWAVRVRWLVIGGFLALALAAHPWGLFPQVRACVFAALAGSAINAFAHWNVKRWKWMLPVTAVSLPADALLITYVVAQTGGADSPFLMMYPVQAVTTAMLVSSGAALASAAFGAACFGVLLLGAGDWWLVAPVSAPSLGLDSVRAARLAAAAWGVFLAYCLLLLVFVGGYIGERLGWSERELARKNRKLEQSVASLGRARDELAAAYERLRRVEAQRAHAEKMQALGLLVAGVAHELNNPLSFISANVEYLRSGWERVMALLRAIDGLVTAPEPRAALQKHWSDLGIEELADDLPAVLADCAEGARRAKAIVEDLRVFSRSASGPGRGWVDVNQCLRSSVALLRHRFGDRIAVHWALAEVPEIRGSETQIKQVFLNLLANAADAVGERGNVWVSSAYDAGRSAVTARVRDDGCGIAPEHMGRIFDPFFTTKEVGAGTGLGLSISYSIVKEHGGTLSVRSAPGDGTEVEVVLPAGSPGEDAEGCAPCSAGSSSCPAVDQER